MVGAPYADAGALVHKADTGGRYPSAVGFRVLEVQPIEELLSCPFGLQHVKGRVLPVLRNDLVFALGL